MTYHFAKYVVDLLVIQFWAVMFCIVKKLEFIIKIVRCSRCFIVSVHELKYNNTHMTLLYYIKH